MAPHGDGVQSLHRSDHGIPGSFEAVDILKQRRICEIRIRPVNPGLSARQPAADASRFAARPERRAVSVHKWVGEPVKFTLNLEPLIDEFLKLRVLLFSGQRGTSACMSSQPSQCRRPKLEREEDNHASDDECPPAGVASDPG